MASELARINSTLKLVQLFISEQLFSLIDNADYWVYLAFCIKSFSCPVDRRCYLCLDVAVNT